MGCCFSSNRGPSGVSPYGSDAHHGSSARAIAASSRAVASDQSAVTSAANVSSQVHGRPSSSQHHGHRTALGEHVNKPLRQHVWSSSKRAWTRVELERERTDFFDTRVSGRPEIWTALKMVIELMQEDMETAQSILDAAAITLPTGDLANGAYDEAGNFYPIPEHVVAFPTNTIEDPDPKGTVRGYESGQSDDEDAIERRREEKGKGVMDRSDSFQVKARLSDRGDADVMVSLTSEETVRTLIHRLQEQITGKGKIRIAYMGKILHEHQSLQAQGWKQGHVVNALVFQ